MPTIEMYLMWTAQAVLGLVVGLAIPVLFRIWKLRIHKAVKLWMLISVSVIVYFLALFGLHQFNTGLLVFLIFVQLFIAFTLYQANRYIRKLQPDEAL